MHSLSIVMCGRNDDCNGDFDLRAKLAIQYNNSLLSKTDLDVEWVWVEWNPVPNRPLFHERFAEWGIDVQLNVVSEEQHARLCMNPAMGLMQFLAKNVGIRRAQGEWILSMNADTYLSDEIVDCLTRIGELIPEDVYLADRINFPSHYLADSSWMALGERDVTFIERVEEAGPGYGAAGDFTLMHREQWWKLRGHFEGISFSTHHLDTLLVKSAERYGANIHVLGAVYHADHANSYVNIIDPDKPHHGGSEYVWNHVATPYENPDNWGLAEGRGVSKPVELVSSGQFADWLAESVAFVRDKGLNTVVYGFGKEFRALLEQEDCWFDFLIGCLDDVAPDDCPWPLLTFEDLSSVRPEAILIGSNWWCYDLAACVKSHGFGALLYPEFLREHEKLGSKRDVIGQ